MYVVLFIIVYFFRCCVNKIDSFKFDKMRFLQFAPTRISANGILDSITFEDERTIFMEKQNWGMGVKIWEKSQKSEDEDEEKTVSSFIAGCYTINICFHYRRKQIIWYSLFTLYRTYMFVQLPMQLKVPYSSRNCFSREIILF